MRNAPAACRGANLIRIHPGLVGIVVFIGGACSTGFGLLCLATHSFSLRHSTKRTTLPELGEEYRSSFAENLFIPLPTVFLGV
jgi:hypothetical protein